jgi:MFS transporter, MCT family, solute carrier family 16 (monocarboxylic acid transporters), member 10
MFYCVNFLVIFLTVKHPGALNFIAPMSIMAGVMTYVWPFATTKGSLIAVALLYGYACASSPIPIGRNVVLIYITSNRFFSGGYSGSWLTPVYFLGEIEDVGRRLGVVMTIASLGALAGPPISGAINKATGGFEVVGYYAGA